MKILKRSIICLLLIFCTACLLCACRDPEPPKTQTYTVMLTIPQGVTVVGDNPMEVEEGADAVFSILLPDKTIFKRASAGIYDATAGTLTVSDVTEDMRITLELEEVEYDTNAELRYFFNGSTKDTSSVPNGTTVKYGTQITVNATDNDLIFIGWVAEGYADRILSTERTFTFRVTPDVAVMTAHGNYIRIAPKYADLSTYYYDPNGGVIHTDTVCASGNAYLSTQRMPNGQMKVTLSQTYLSYATCATAFWNDGTFTRDGYVLKEFNTEPDGSGDAYSPGSKFYPYKGEESFVLYCIWEPYTASEFTYEPVTMPYPEVIGEDVSKATHWRTEGVKITGYSGNAQTLAVPDTLGGLPVIAIGSGAIRQKDVTTLILPRHIQSVEDGAIVGCDQLTTIYYPNSIYYIGDACMDSASYESFTTLIVCATMAPRYSKDEYGDFSIKMSRLLATMERNRIIIISGSSSYQGLSTPYLEALFNSEYAVINFGTTRTAHCALYLEAIKAFTHDGDIVIYSPENSTYLMGDNVLYWKTFRDLEGMNNIYRHIDISNYDHVFSSLSGYNQGTPYKGQKVTAYYSRAAQSYEQICERTRVMNKYGDDINSAKDSYVVDKKYYDAYTVTLNAFYRNTNEGHWSASGAQNDYTDTYYWSDITAEPYLSMMRYCVSEAKKGGANVYFGFCPTDRNSLIDEVDEAWMAAYDALMRDSYGFDGIIGTSADFVYDHRYFYDCAFHTNNYGRTWHTYNLYVYICDVLGRETEYSAGDLGTNFAGCLFEKDGRGQVVDAPKYP